MSNNKIIYVIVCGNIYESGKINITAACDSLDEARNVLKKIEKKYGPDQYGNPDTVCYGKECCYYIIQLPLNQLPSYMK